MNFASTQKFLSIDGMAIVGQDKKAKLVKNPRGILLLTPESLESLFINRTAALERMFSHLEFVVIDELHAFVGRERGTHMRSLLNRLEQRIKHNYRIFALSATLGDWPNLYAQWLRPKAPESVRVIEDRSAFANRSAEDLWLSK